MKKVSELIVGCYMICVVLAQKAFLSNEVIDGLMDFKAHNTLEDLFRDCNSRLLLCKDRKANQTRYLCLMESVVGSWTEDTKISGLICLSVLAQQKPAVAVPSQAAGNDPK
jgi:U3 small nucleolar RNA-associated protein 10